MAHIGIIGGGISGLTIAWLLREKGHTVRVFEASEHTGGAMRTTRNPDGWMAEWGPNTIIESSKRIMKLVDMLGLKEQRCYPHSQAKKRYLVRNGKPVAVPDSLRSLISTDLLTYHAKWAMIREPFIRRKKTSDIDESLAGFVRRRLGEEFLKWPIDALVGGIYAGDPEILSVKHAFPRLALLEQQHGSLILGQIKGGVKRGPDSDEIPRNKARIFSFQNGMQTLPDALSGKLTDSLLTNFPITSIQRDRRYWKVTGPGDFHYNFDAVVYAGTAYGLNKISIQKELQALLEPLINITHPPVVSLTMGFPRENVEHPLDGFGILVPGIENFPILGTLFTSSLFSDRAPDKNHVTLTTYIGGMRQPDLAQKNEEQLVSLTRNTLQKLLGVHGKPHFVQSIFWPKAIPQYEMGFGHYLSLMQDAEEQNPGFFMAGNYRTGISVGDSINSAFDMAERISKHFDQS